MDVKLGSEVVDMTTGQSGVVVNRTELLGGTIQYAIQLPASSDASRQPDLISIDRESVNLVGDGISDRAVSADSFKFELGNEVEDLVSGFQGMVVSRTVFINACLYYMVEAKGVGKPEERQRFLTEQRLKFVSDGVAIKPKKTGGPTTRGMRAC